MVGLAEIEYQQPSARPGHTMHLRQSSFPTRQIPQAVADGHNVEMFVGKWQLRRIALLEADGTLPSAFCPLPSAFLPRHAQHRLAKVQPHHLGSVTGEAERDVSGDRKST